MAPLLAKIFRLFLFLLTLAFLLGYFIGYSIGH